MRVQDSQRDDSPPSVRHPSVAVPLGAGEERPSVLNEGLNLAVEDDRLEGANGPAADLQKTGERPFKSLPILRLKRFARLKCKDDRPIVSLQTIT